MKDDKLVPVGVLGASGYIGAELLRYIVPHPRLRLAWASAHSQAGSEIAGLFPNLRGFVEGDFLSRDEAEARLAEVDVVFVALPHTQSPEVIPRVVEKRPEAVFIDLAGDFRTPDPAGYLRYYGVEHPAPEWLHRFAIYGFTPMVRDRLPGAKLVANPGCFATGALLALAPLAQAGRLRGDVCHTGITGSSGSGNRPRSTTHHPERMTNVRSYKPLAHQHLLELESFLRSLAPTGSEEFRLQFVPTSGPFVRGIFTTLLLPGAAVDETLALFESAYADEPLIDVIEGSPELRWVQGTPRSFVGVAGEDDRGAVVFSVTDNLGKGAASQAIENLNAILGWAPDEGLRTPGGFV